MWSARVSPASPPPCSCSGAGRGRRCTKRLRAGRRPLPFVLRRKLGATIDSGNHLIMSGSAATAELPILRRSARRTNSTRAGAAGIALRRPRHAGALDGAHVAGAAAVDGSSTRTRACRTPAPAIT